MSENTAVTRRNLVAGMAVGAAGIAASTMAAQAKAEEAPANEGLKMYVLGLGTIKSDYNTIVFNHTLATIDNPNPDAIYGPAPVYAILIDGPNGRVLYDSGCNPEAMGENGRWPMGVQKTYYLEQPEEAQLLNRLAQLGYGPDDIDYVVTSHIHVDHAGCLEFFPNATHVVSDVEFTTVSKMYCAGIAGSYCWADMDAAVKAGLNWRLIAEDEDNVELMPGVKILNLGPGHSYGMLAIQVELPNSGTYILASDAVYSSGNYEPAKLAGSFYDSLGYFNTIKRIKKIQAETNAQVWFGHDAAQFDSLTLSTEGCYE